MTTLLSLAPVPMPSLVQSGRINPGRKGPNRRNEDRLSRIPPNRERPMTPETTTNQSHQRKGAHYKRREIPTTATAAMKDNLEARAYAAQGRRVPNCLVDGNLTISSNRSSTLKPDTVHVDFDLDINRWLRSSRAVQWYPGHIAKAEKELKQQLKLMDVVIEVRDARIPMATGHPEMDSWIGAKKKILVLNRVDMVSTADKNAWATYFSRQGLTVVLANGQLGMGTMKLARVAKSLASNVNDKRRAKGLLPRAIRAGVVGYPNVGKSSLINRLLKRRICEAASRPGVTRVLKWVRIGQDLDLLDSPGILPMRFSDQAAATKLAICDDIGERSYEIDGVAAILIEILKRLPTAGTSDFGILQASR